MIDENEIKSPIKKEMTVIFFFSQGVILLLALVIGWIAYRKFTWFLPMLTINTKFVLLGIICGIVGILFNTIVTNLFKRIIPKKMLIQEETDKEMFKDRSLIEIILIFLLASISEELLFRGVIQNLFGLWIATIIFIIVHYRYFKYLYRTAMLTVICIFIGLMYEYFNHNLIPVISLHFIYNLIGGLLLRYFPNGLKISFKKS